jgi:N-acetyl-alpha-D-muramate 1-phosphate uridylyltransferase
MILAAGRGERMRPLSDTLPKPLLKAGGKPLVHWQLERLAQAGFRRIVINHAHLGAMLEEAIGDGRRWNVEVIYSPEKEALETAGGIRQALPLLGAETFAVLNGDVYTDYDFADLGARIETLRSQPQAQVHLVLVDNPEHHPDGDFFYHEGAVLATGTRKLTFSGIAVYRRELFEPLVAGAKHKLSPLLSGAIAGGRARGEHYRGVWFDIGTPERLAALDNLLRMKSP